MKVEISTFTKKLKKSTKILACLSPKKQDNQNIFFDFRQSFFIICSPWPSTLPPPPRPLPLPLPLLGRCSSSATKMGAFTLLNLKPSDIEVYQHAHQFLQRISYDGQTHFWILVLNIGLVFSDITIQVFFVDRYPPFYPVPPACTYPHTSIHTPLLCTHFLHFFLWQRGLVPGKKGTNDKAHSEKALGFCITENWGFTPFSFFLSLLPLPTGRNKITLFYNFQIVTQLQ